MQHRAWICATLLFAATGCGKELERKLAELEATLDEVRQDFAAYREDKQHEIDQLTAELATLQGRLRSTAQGQFEAGRRLAEVEKELAAKGAEAADALARAADLVRAREALENQLQNVTKARDALKSQLESAQKTLASHADKVDALTAELTQLKRLLGR